MDTVALIRRSLRRLLRVPAFTTVCVLTLAVGIGATTTIFSIVDGVLLTPLPYPESERLVGLWHTAPAFGFDKLSQSPGTYLLYRERSRSFEDIALYRSSQVNVTGDGTPERLSASLITPSLFPVLRVKPSLGRAFVAEEGRPGAAPVVLLSDQLWRRRFAADPGAVGSQIRINGVPRAIVGVMPAGFEFPRPETELWLPLREIGIDGRVLLFTAAAAVLSSLLAGLFPALRSLLKEDLALELKTGGTRTTSGHAQRRMRKFLVGLQVGLVLVLFTGSGLMLRSFLRLSHLDPGFATDDVLTFQLSLPEQDFPEDVAVASLLDRVVERLAALPGVRSAGVASTLPLAGSAQASGYLIEDLPLHPGAPEPVLWYGYASEGYFEALGIPLLAGRTLTRADQENRAGVVVVNRAAARHFWPRGNALGKRLRPGAAEGESDPWYTIVGIVGDVRNREVAKAPDEMVYYPLLGKTTNAWAVRQAHVVLRTRVAPESLARDVRSVVRSVDPNVPVSGMRTMEQIFHRSQTRMIYSVLMFVLATAVAIVLAAVGIYSFVSYVVSQRTAEVGVRMALGARARDIRWLILRESLAIALAGILVGLLGAVALTRSLGSLLFEISPLDPLTFLIMPLLLLALVLLSSALPAERAARVSPAKALQSS